MRARKKGTMYVQGQRHATGGGNRLAAVLGPSLGFSANVRRKIEAHLLMFGVNPGKARERAPKLKKKRAYKKSGGRVQECI
jgi:hypothetical protein